MIEQKSRHQLDDETPCSLDVLLLSSTAPLMLECSDAPDPSIVVVRLLGRCRVETRRITPDPLRSPAVRAPTCGVKSCRTTSVAPRWAPLCGVKVLCRITSVEAPRQGRHSVTWRALAPPLCGQVALSAATPQRTLRVRNAQVVRRRTAPVCRVMVGPGF